MNKIFVSCLAMMLFFSARAERQPYERYQSIVDRQMFGPLPPGFDPEKLPSEVARSGGVGEGEALTKEQEQVKSSVHFSVINVTPDGKTAVGFTDNSDPKTPKHYYLKVGESRDGWTLKEADPVGASMTIVKNGVEVALSLGGDSAKGAGKTERASAAVGNASPTGNASRRPGGALFANSLRARRNLRLQEQQEREAKAKEEAAEKEAKSAAEREELRNQLSDITEQLRKAREERAAKERENKSEQDESSASEE